MLNFNKWFLLLAISCSVSGWSWLRPMPGKFAIEGEVLWLKASLDDRYFGISDPFTLSQFTVIGPRLEKQFDFHAAYRLEGAYTFCNGVNDFRLSYMHFSNTVTRSENGRIVMTQLPQVEAQSIGTVGGAVDEAQSETGVRFYTIDALFGHLIYCSCPLDIDLQLGLQYANLKTNEKYTYISTVPIIGVGIAEYSNNFSGIGPELAIDLRYRFPSYCCFNKGELSFVSKAKGTILASQNRAKIRSTSSAFPLFSHVNENEKEWRVIPSWDFQLGVNYMRAFCLCTFSIEAGYELISYSRAIGKIRYVTDSGGASTGYSFDEYNDFTLQGPYLSLALTY